MRHLLTLLVEGFAGGLAALLMPCIFPMLPLTAGFFAKRQGGVWDALAYGLSIMVIYVGLGLLVTVLFGAGALNDLATNGIFNLVFFGLLVLFAASFLGGFDLALPSSWANKAEGRTGNGLTGIFFMAAALALVSFSCTGPIIGTLLVQAAAEGQRLGPAAGMLGFSTALALPFVLFALFPGWLAKLPKSGNWLNRVKVVLGFLELALALKFLSNVDLAYHWRLFDREVFLVLWVVIFALLGLYVLGLFKMVSVPRLFLGMIVMAFTIYMIPGLWGAPLKSIAAFLPPQETQDFDLYTRPRPVQQQVKYAELFQAPLGLPAFFDYEEGMAYAQKMHLPVMIDFTGHACVNCRKMEATVWPSVLPLIRQYVLIQLYVDDKADVGNTTIGKRNSKLQEIKFNSNSQPDYVLLDDKGKILVAPQGAIYDTAAYGAFLQSGLDAFKKNE